MTNSTSKLQTGSYLTSLFGLEGKTAVVIGGSGVLGSAISIGLARAGARVIIASRDADAGAARVREITESGGSAESMVVDCTKRADLERLVANLMEQERPCHILVNGAGVNSPTPFLEISDEEWDRIFHVNLTSVKVACQVIGAYMLQTQTRGSIINIASLSAITPLSRVFTYSASKAAVLNLTQNLAREWGDRGIRVNALSPGFFPAEQNRKVLTPERIENVMRHTPMNRFGSPEELAGGVLLLASEVAGSFVTGTNLVIDGGFTAMTI